MNHGRVGLTGSMLLTAAPVFFIWLLGLMSPSADFIIEGNIECVLITLFCVIQRRGNEARKGGRFPGPWADQQNSHRAWPTKASTNVRRLEGAGLRDEFFLCGWCVCFALFVP